MKAKLQYILIGLFIFGVLFYWFQYRPSKIRANCAGIATEKAKDKLKYEADKPGGGWGELEDAAARGMFRQEDYRVYFFRCLDEHGLK